MRPGGGRLRRRAGAAGQRRRLPRRVAADRKAGRRRPFAHDPRREGRHPACAVEILVGGRSAPGHSRGVVHRRPSRHPPRGPVGRMGPGRLDERLLHGFPGADVPCRDVESRNVGAVWQIHRRGGALPREGHPAGTRREHLPHAAQRPQFRVHGRGPLPLLADGRSLHRGGAEERRCRLRETFRTQ